jgi:hypothetical protein
MQTSNAGDFTDKHRFVGPVRLGSSRARVKDGQRGENTMQTGLPHATIKSVADSHPMLDDRAVASM